MAHLASNARGSLAKIATGGWSPLAVATAVFTVMTTRKRGREILWARISSETLPVEVFIADIDRLLFHSTQSGRRDRDPG